MCYGRADGNRLQRTIVAAGKQHNSHGEKNAGKRGRPEPHGTLLSRPKTIWSGRRDLNPRLRPWQGRTLPLSYSRSTRKLYRICATHRPFTREKRYAVT